MNVPDEPLFWVTVLILLMTLFLVGQTVHTEITKELDACRDVNGSVVQSGELLFCEFENGSRVPLGDVVNESETG